MNEYRIEYTILSADSIPSLVRQVNAHIKQGGEPQGGISITPDPGRAAFSTSRMYCQAMVKLVPNTIRIKITEEEEEE